MPLDSHWRVLANFWGKTAFPGPNYQLTPNGQYALRPANLAVLTPTKCNVMM